MEKSIKLLDKDIAYTLKVTKRLKSIRLAVYAGGSVVVSASRYIPQFIINQFLISKAKWLITKIEKMSKFEPVVPMTKKQKKDEYLKFKEAALQIVEERLDYFNRFYNYQWRKITVRNQKTRWGSCSKNGNLSFNYKIALLPSNAADYIIVHELCHLKEFNHSQKFWKLVSQTMPDHKDIRNTLKKKSPKLN